MLFTICTHHAEESVYYAQDKYGRKAYNSKRWAFLISTELFERAHIVAMSNQRPTSALALVQMLIEAI